jgi:hypothetical protein
MNKTELLGTYLEDIKTQVIYRVIGGGGDEIVLTPLNIDGGCLPEPTLSFIKFNDLINFYQYGNEMTDYLKEKICQTINESALEKIGFEFSDSESDEGDDTIMLEYSHANGLVCTIIRHGDEKIGFCEVSFNEMVIGKTKHISDILALLKAVNTLKTNKI